MKLLSMLVACWLANVVFLGSVSAHAADGSPVWTNYFNGTGGADDAATAIAVDAGGNVYVTGWSVGSGGNYDYLTIKYSAAGLPLWTKRFSSLGFYDQPNALALDSSNNVYVTGTAFFNGGSGWDFLTIKYSTDGVPIWTNRFNGTGNDDDGATSLRVDVSGNVYVTGYSVGSGSGYDFLTIKYSTSGVALWTNRFNGTGNGSDGATGLALDASSNVYVTGYSVGNGSGYDYATIKYSSAGVGLWTNRFNGAGNDNDQASALALDASGNAYVTGFSTGSASGYDYATIKYSTAGVPLWTNIFNGTANGNDSANALAVDANGNVYVTGSLTSSGVDSDWATFKYSTAGVALWTNIFKGAANQNDSPRTLKVDSGGNVYVAGSFYGSGSHSDGLTIKYSTTGAALWTNVINNAASLDDMVKAMALDALGNVYVAGYSVVSDNNPDFVTIKYSG
ncbi:MAG: SBBP repeat-containing protein, partial [Verrucomicrobiota bacterium]